MFWVSVLVVLPVICQCTADKNIKTEMIRRMENLDIRFVSISRRSYGDRRIITLEILAPDTTTFLAISPESFEPERFKQKNNKENETTFIITYRPYVSYKGNLVLSMETSVTLVAIIRYKAITTDGKILFNMPDCQFAISNISYGNKVEYKGDDNCWNWPSPLYKESYFFSASVSTPYKTFYLNNKNLFNLSTKWKDVFGNDKNVQNDEKSHITTALMNYSKMKEEGTKVNRLTFFILKELPLKFHGSNKYENSIFNVINIGFDINV